MPLCVIADFRTLHHSYVRVIDELGARQLYALHFFGRQHTRLPGYTAHAVTIAP